jgi:N-acetylmuramoyl-L-alanine amidase
VVTEELRAVRGRLIRKGDRGEAVRDVQGRLSRIRLGGTPELSPDGAFDETTLQAVRHFQRSRGLAADGIVGPETWRALTEAGHQLGDRLLWHASTQMRGDDVLELQSRLNRLGFDAGQEDGIFGRDTREALEEFQRNVGLAVDGVGGPETIELLRRLHRGHQSGGIGARARQREELRELGGRGLIGTRVMVDPVRGGDDPGRVGPGGVHELEVNWSIARRVVARLSARGASAVLSRGPANGGTASARARQANELSADLVVSIATNSHSSPVARGCASYYFGTGAFVSEAGYALAHCVQDEMVADGWTPDCGVHQVTWTLLRETRMPAVVVEPGFITSPEDEAALASPARQDRLAAALTRGIARFLSTPAESAAAIR